MCKSEGHLATFVWVQNFDINIINQYTCYLHIVPSCGSLSLSMKELWKTLNMLELSNRKVEYASRLLSNYLGSILSFLETKIDTFLLFSLMMQAYSTQSLSMNSQCYILYSNFNILSI